MSWLDFFKSLHGEWKRDRVSDVARALTFSGVLALFPFLLFLVSLASFFISPADVTAIVGELRTVAPPEVVQILEERLTALAKGESAGVLTIGGLLALWAASSGVTALIAALNTAYGVQEGRPVWKVRLIAVGMTLVASVLSIVATFVLVGLLPLAGSLQEPWPTLVAWLRLPLSGMAMMLLWALMYYFLPDVEQEFKFITPGSVVGVILWLAASWGFSLYVTNLGKYEATYGALGGVVVLLLWMWISSQVLLLGAEINAVIEHRSDDGKAPGKKHLGERGPNLTKTELEERVGSRAPLPRPGGPVQTNPDEIHH